MFNINGFIGLGISNRGKSHCRQYILVVPSCSQVFIMWENPGRKVWKDLWKCLLWFGPRWTPLLFDLLVFLEYDWTVWPHSSRDIPTTQESQWKTFFCIWKNGMKWFGNDRKRTFRYSGSFLYGNGLKFLETFVS